MKQAGRGGLGTVLRNKKVKAVVANWVLKFTMKSEILIDISAICDL